MHAILKKPIWIGDSYFAKGMFSESNPKTKMLFQKDWFLESLKKEGFLELHPDVIEEKINIVDSVAPEKDVPVVEVVSPAVEANTIKNTKGKNTGK